MWVGRRAAEERLSYGGQLMSADGLLGVTTAKLPAKSRRLVVTGESGAAGETVTSGRKKVEALPWKAGGWPKAVSGSASGCGLCDTAVRRLLQLDSGEQFSYAPLQGSVGAAACVAYGAPSDLSTMYVRVRGWVCRSRFWSRVAEGGSE